MKFRNKLSLAWSTIRFIVPNIYFNFHYLPFRQACRMPILFYKPHFGILKGKIQIVGGGKICHDSYGVL